MLYLSLMFDFLTEVEKSESWFFLRYNLRKKERVIWLFWDMVWVLWLKKLLGASQGLVPYQLITNYHYLKTLITENKNMIHKKLDPNSYEQESQNTKLS